ncbi:uncharacterized protein MONOS_32 [Monocercomonoides exilis]|uniref:uncharacterized protein n=1 Tax=Monocercomonoides exilis TaxID=2049356 RepID=UPI003559A72B|nr:hypothetical protein MONOS_32 [Monocercomonoides exilis]|eukprot:MONOS_32.1-p1 / transcript=MONOS_32.1 / gene=MONOS_32 / organism=Monocercomonoides_exilis_PA203 / gene_product=unspecified product / transcript_product=unspecified product / location=Mono_scaffold00001:91772-92449(+) / protein_length=169 / sequence_SO=supercontig / SO=protein_coding / is_pseudo=false
MSTRLSQTQASKTARSSGKGFGPPTATVTKRSCHLTPELTMSKALKSTTVHTSMRIPKWKEKVEVGTTEYRAKFQDTVPYMKRQFQEAKLRGSKGGKMERTMPTRRQHAPAQKDAPLYEINPLFVSDKTRFRTTYSTSYLKLPTNIVGMENPEILKETIGWTHHQAQK